jgi:hypothetical protein
VSDIFHAAGYAAIVYLLFNYLITFRSGQPLGEWINPNRHYLLPLAGTLVAGAYGMLRIAASKNPGVSQLELLRMLVNEEKASAQVVGGMSMLVFAATLVLLAGYCWARLPRAPRTFNANPGNLSKEYRKALRHYVRWKGGLDYGLLFQVRGGALEVTAEGGYDKEILRGLDRLPGLHAEGVRTPADVAKQKRVWYDLAAGVFAKWRELNALVAPARHGHNVTIAFDLRYGAMFAEMIEEEPNPPDGSGIGVFLFAVAMNQHEVNSLNAHRHFAAMSQAVRHIRTGVMKG